MEHSDVDLVTCYNIFQYLLGILVCSNIAIQKMERLQYRNQSRPICPKF